MNPTAPKAPPSSQLLQIKLNFSSTLPTQAEDLNPTVDYTKKRSKFTGARYVIECGMKLKASVLTTATACTYYHKFYKVASLEEYDPYLIGSTCIYLASKVEDDDIKIRDIINVGVSCVRRADPPLSLDPYFSMRDSLIQSELLLMRILGFKMKVDLPHKYLLFYLHSLTDWIGKEELSNQPVANLSWTILQDIYHFPLILDHGPQLLAVAAINLALQIYGIVVPGDDEVMERSWFTFLHPECSNKSVWDLTTRILTHYKKEDELEFVTSK